MPISQLHHLLDPATCRRLVVKIGSSLLVEHDEVREAWLAQLVTELAAAGARGQQVIVVSSGAIALGAGRLGLDKGGRGSLADAQAAAAVGQITLSGLWARMFAEHRLTAAQILLTLDDLEDRRRYLNVTATLARLLDAGAVPVINENDSVATEEIRFGDNDRLAARVAQASRADAVLLLSDVNGLYDRDPGQPEARLLPMVRGVDAEVRAMASGASGSGIGSGGMTSKLQAAEIAGRAGIVLIIANGMHDAPLARAAGTGAAPGIGTLFLPRFARGRSEPRKAWLGGRMRTKGALIVDAGAAGALERGTSLLARGVIEIEGDFARGDAVAIRDRAGHTLAHGLAEYAARECRLLIGTHSNEQAAILGYAPRSAIVHRDQLVML